MAPLPMSLERARELWGDSEVVTHGEADGDPVEVHEFEHLFFIGIRATVWRGDVHRLMYLSPRSDPDRDLLAVFLRHGAGQGWMIGVHTDAIMRAKGNDATEPVESE